MDVRFLTLSPPDLFTVLGVAVDVIVHGKIGEDISIGPFDDRLLTRHGVWLSGSDTEISKAVAAIEKALTSKKIIYVWSVENVMQNEAQG